MHSTLFQSSLLSPHAGSLISPLIDELIAGLTDWRGKTLAGIRKSILEPDREIIEEWKWMGSPVWSRDGIIAVGNAHKDGKRACIEWSG
jgi:hypothetical protein